MTGHLNRGLLSGCPSLNKISDSDLLLPHTSQPTPLYIARCHEYNMLLTISSFRHEKNMTVPLSWPDSENEVWSDTLMLT